MKHRSMSSGFRLGIMGTYVSMADTHTGAGSGAVSGSGTGGPMAAVRVVADVRGRAIFAVVARTVRIFVWVHFPSSLF